MPGIVDPKLSYRLRLDRLGFNLDVGPFPVEACCEWFMRSLFGGGRSEVFGEEVLGIAPQQFLFRLGRCFEVLMTVHGGTSGTGAFATTTIAHGARRGVGPKGLQMPPGDHRAPGSKVCANAEPSPPLRGCGGHGAMMQPMVLPLREIRRAGRAFVLLAGVVGLLVAPAALDAVAKSPRVAHVTTRRDADRQASAVVAPPAWLAATDGGVFALGSAPFRGSVGGTHLNQPVIAVAGNPSGNGYWLAAFDGGVFTFGDARFHGSLGSTHLNMPIVDMVATPSGAGYWLVAADGGVFSFGDAHFYGSLGATHLNQPITGMVPTPSGRGYWLVAADGGVFTFGDARFYGSLGGATVTPAIAALAAAPDGHGYWLLRRDGSVYHFGTAAPLPAAAGAAVLAAGLVPTRSGRGYWIAFIDGTVRAFGDAAPVALPPIRLAAPVVGIATPWASSSGYALPLLEFLRARQRTWVGPHEVALTFDDGPSDYTPAVLAVLTRYNVPATFFPVGYLAAAHPDLLVAEAHAGMSVQVHSWDHADLTRLSVPAIRDELIRTANAIQAAVGRRPACFRPPYGSTNGTVAAEGAKLGLTQILWNVDPSDYLRPGANVIASRVLAAANGRGLVVTIHDGGGDRSQTVTALPAIIEGLHARGYTFVRLCA